MGVSSGNRAKLLLPNSKASTAFSLRDSMVEESKEIEEQEEEEEEEEDVDDEDIIYDEEDTMSKRGVGKA